MRWLCFLVVISAFKLSSGNLLEFEANDNNKISSYVKSLIDDFIARDPSVKDVAIVSLSMSENTKRKVDDLVDDVRQSTNVAIAVSLPSLRNINGCNFRTFPFIIFISDNLNVRGYFCLHTKEHFNLHSLSHRRS